MIQFSDKELDLIVRISDSTPYLTSKQAAAHLQLSEKIMRAWRTRRIGPPFIRISHGAIRYRLADLNAFMIARAVQTTRIPAAGAGPLTPRMKRDLALTRD